MAPMTRAFTADIEHFIAARGLDLVRFASGQRKDLVTAGYLCRAELDGRGGGARSGAVRGRGAGKAEGLPD